MDTNIASQRKGSETQNGSFLHSLWRIHQKDISVAVLVSCALEIYTLKMLGYFYNTFAGFCLVGQAGGLM